LKKKKKKKSDDFGRSRVHLTHNFVVNHSLINFHLRVFKFTFMYLEDTFIQKSVQSSTASFLFFNVFLSYCN